MISLQSSILLALFLSLLKVNIIASPINQEKACASYTLVDTRGTYEPQGPSIGFRGMVSGTLTSIPGGKEYDTVYPAAQDQNSTLGTIDIVREVRSRKTDCYALLGYSQGAVAAITALPQLEDQFDSIKAIVLIGDPLHQPDLPCNVDSLGGKSTSGAKGIGSARGGIGQKWIEKTLDICAKGDNICDFTQPDKNITLQHLSYGFDEYVQTMGAKFLENRLKHRA